MRPKFGIFPGSVNNCCSGYYPNVIALYKKLGVAFKAANFSYSFSFMSQPMAAQQRRVTTTAIYEGASGLNGVSKPAILRGSPYDKDQNYLLYLFCKAWGTGLFFVLRHVAVSSASRRPCWRTLDYTGSRAKLEHSQHLASCLARTTKRQLQHRMAKV